MLSSTAPFARGYFGRVTAVGLTASGQPALWYAFTGRGKPSRQRRATIQRPAAGQLTVEIGPLRPPGRRSDPATAALLLLSKPGLGVAGSTPRLAELGAALSAGAHPQDALRSALARWGPEPPPYRTPRTAAVLVPAGPRAWMGATTEPDTASSALISLAPGRFECLPTASGAAGSTAPIGADMEAELVEVRLGEGGAPGLAEAVYGLFDPELIVCAVAAVWEQEAGAWDVALRNLHQE
ncbi:MAG: hypothetical protein HY330_01160 [Chloroflexi bacterium]|nr:hypothetical protein [Chloroflexota bacterium]